MLPNKFYIGFIGVSNRRYGAKMLLKNYAQKICLFYILVLFLWGTISAVTPTTEMAGLVCDEQDCYVNHSPSITSLGSTFPSQEYLSARHANAQETVSVARGRSIRPLPRSARNIATFLYTGILFAGIIIFSRHFTKREILSHCLCGIVITQYIHAQDGQKI